MAKFKVGDLVASCSPGYVLHCGSGVYSRAVVIQERPLVLVSESTDMRWQHVEAESLEVVGRAEPEVLAACMRRLAR